MTIKITSPTLAIALLLALPAVCGAEETLDSDLESEIVRGEEAVEAADLAPPQKLEEIVVTALKGGQGTSVADTAMAISAFTGADLEGIGAVDIDGFIKQIPGVSLTSRDPANTRIQIRGVSGDVGDALIGYYLDDFPIVSLNAVSTPQVVPFDLERVEVLRGPQGTLYGAGSLGGTVRMLTNQPDLSMLTGKIDLSYQDIDQGGTIDTVQGMVNVPLIEDVWGLRVMGHWRDQDGWVDLVNFA